MMGLLSLVLFSALQSVNAVTYEQGSCAHIVEAVELIKTNYFKVDNRVIVPEDRIEGKTGWDYFPTQLDLPGTDVHTSIRMLPTDHAMGLYRFYIVNTSSYSFLTELTWHFNHNVDTDPLLVLRLKSPPNYKGVYCSKINPVFGQNGATTIQMRPDF